jgi:hypothetical protein
MFKEVLSLFDSNSLVWSLLVLVANGVNRLRSISDRIEASATHQQSNNPVGHTAAKEQQRALLEELTYQGVVRLRSYATATKNAVLLAITNVARGVLSRKKNSALLTFSRVIADACEANLGALGEYRIDANFVTTLRENIELCSQLYSQRDVVIDQRKGATGQLTSLVNEGRKCVKELDDLVAAFIEDDTFLREYTNARRIYDLRGRRIVSSESKPEGAAE